MAEGHIIAITKCVTYLFEHFVSFREMLEDDDSNGRRVFDGVVEKKVFDAFQNLLQELEAETRNVGSLAPFLMPDTEYLKRLYERTQLSHYMPIEDLHSIHKMHQHAEMNAGKYRDIYRRRYAGDV
jgi:hypothetical protein